MLNMYELQIFPRRHKYGHCFQIDFKGKLTYSEHAGIDILQASSVEAASIPTYFIREQQFGHEFP